MHIDCKLRGCDLVCLKVNDVYAAGRVKERASVKQSKTRKPVRFEITETTRLSVERWIKDPEMTGREYLWPSRVHASPHLSTRQYARIMRDWVLSIGLEPSAYGTHSMRRTKIAQIHKKTGNLARGSTFAGAYQDGQHCALSRGLARDHGRPRQCSGGVGNRPSPWHLRLKGNDMNDMVTISREEYDRLQTAAEDLADLQAYDRTNAALAVGEDELIPSDYANRLLNGESPLRVYRDLRGKTQAALAEKAGVGRVLVAEIETGRKQGSVATLRALAKAIGVTLDDLAA